MLHSSDHKNVIMHTCVCATALLSARYTLLYTTTCIGVFTKYDYDMSLSKLFSQLLLLAARQTQIDFIEDITPHPNLSQRWAIAPLYAGMVQVGQHCPHTFS